MLMAPHFSEFDPTRRLHARGLVVQHLQEPVNVIDLAKLERLEAQFVTPAAIDGAADRMLGEMAVTDGDAVDTIDDLVEGGQGRDAADVNGDAAALMVLAGVVGLFGIAAGVVWLLA